MGNSKKKQSLCSFISLIQKKMRYRTIKKMNDAYLIKDILLYIKQCNMEHQEPDSIDIASTVAKKFDITIDKPFAVLMRLVEAKIVIRGEGPLGGFNGNNWHTLNEPTASEYLKML